MSAPPNAPRLVRGGIVLVDPDTAAVLRIIALQYNPATLTRTLAIHGAGKDTPDRSEVLRIKGPPTETIKLEADIDAVDQLELGAGPATTSGIFPQLAALEILVYPTSAQLLANNALQQAGKLEILPMEAPLPLFVWSKNRVIPVRITDFSITEEAFDVNLNPIQAKVSLGLRVLTVDDAGFDHRAGSLFMSYLAQKEQFAAGGPQATLDTLGIRGI
ncbi:hypothetical protein CVV68_13420 [Arthrobacter livingstonensis]|uniref:Uncharacterized protein n=1 Tax=Arthrobacter livingstonensis TaxID=670078 RepID=A0A2V5L5C3_9MICC|nr:hypothetical protein [Arthrobacter livingstonensis]PYI66565.1 hypothetical protein CVV68_13420 [Arthrobacter livingstonensis]